MAGNSTYLQNKHKGRGQVFHRAPKAGFCISCQRPVPHAELFKGWCVGCIAAWGASADRAAIESARAEYASLTTSRVSVAATPPTTGAYERLRDRVAARRPDEWFIPMTLYIGNYTVGQAQANWNFLQAMYELEIMSTAHAFKFGKESHDVLHLCGRHAPMQGMSLASFIGRVINSPEVWRDVEPAMREYVQDFIAAQGGGFRCLVTPRQRISAVTHDPSHCRRSYRRDPNYKGRKQIAAEKAAFQAKYGGVIQPTAAFWPFAVRKAPSEHEMLHAIDRLTRGIPEQWRQDVCQDLVVSVLSGDATLDNLQDALPQHIKTVFKLHPIKYGDASLDAPVMNINGSGSVTLGQLLAQIEQEDREDEESADATPDVCGWHAGWDRPVGLASVGETLRVRHGGVAIPTVEDE